MQNLIITNKGQELMAKMIAGTSTAKFTKICTSDYDYTGVVLEELLNLYQIKQTTLVSNVSRTDTTIVEVLGAMNNSELTEGYYIKGVGLYAKDSDNVEILYAISVSDKPDYMPPFSGQTVSGITFRLNTKVDNSEQVTLEVNPAAIPTIEQLNNVVVKIDAHSGLGVNGEIGVHGLRYFNEALQFDDGEGNWIEIETGGGGIAPNNVLNPSIKVGKGKLTIKWSDPGDTIVEGQTLSTWKGTKLVMKAGAYPTNIKDGTVLLDNLVKDKYKNNGFEINSLTNGTKYYFQLFPYSDKNSVNENVANRLEGTPQPFKIMGVDIDLTNSNPKTSVTYVEDAIGMTEKSPAWDEFFGHKPCLFKNGAVVGYLNPNDYTKFESGATADITSGNAGDVMVEFPRRGLKIETVGNIVKIRMTDDLDNPDFEYLAHTRGSVRKDKFYLGAYKGHNLSSKLRSLSGKDPTATQTIGTFRTQAQANGTGYDQSGFYQLIFRQCMYILKYKNLDSQVALGRGFVDGNSAAINTGGTDKKGMDFGETTGKLQMKLFGLEDFWGNVREWIDGMFSNSTRNILTATDNFNDTGAGYMDNGQGATADGGGYMSKPQGTTKAGFVIKEASGSDTTYFTDDAYLGASCLPNFGGYWSDASRAGAFYLYVYGSASSSIAYLGGRLMFL